MKPIVRKEKVAEGIPKHHSTAKKKTQKPDYTDPSTYDSSKWVFSEQHFSGSMIPGKQTEIQGDITEGLENFMANPAKYVAIYYQTSMTEWPLDQQKYFLVHRESAQKSNFQPVGCSDDGWMTVKMAAYQPLPKLEDLGAEDWTDEYVDDMEYQGIDSFTVAI